MVLPASPKVSDVHNRNEDLSHFPRSRITSNDVIFQLFTNSEKSINIKAIDVKSKSVTDNYKSTWPMRVFIHGWGSHAQEAKRLAKAYFEKFNGEVNFIAVKWIKGAEKDENYFIAAKNVDIVGKEVANLLDFLIETFPNDNILNLLVMIGHSLGAQAMAICKYRIIHNSYTFPPSFLLRISLNKIRFLKPHTI